MRIYFTAFFLLFSSSVAAIDYNTKNHINIGVNAFYRDYSEALTPPKKSDEYGMLYGIVLGYERKAPACVMFAFDSSLALGETHYDGSLQSRIGEYLGPFESTTQNGFFNLETKVGYTFQKDEKHLITPFLGLGMGSWLRALGYDEFYGWFYLAYGLQYDYNANPKWQYGLHAKIMPMLYGEMDLMPYYYNDNDNVMTLGNKTHFEISAPILYRHNPNSKNYWRFTPYYQYQRFGESNVIYVADIFDNIYVNEPASRAHIVGLKAEFAFGFC